MKTIYAVLFFVVAALAQSVTILSPTINTTLSPGDNFVVDVDKPDSLSPSYDVSVAIGLQSCGAAPCAALASAGILGNILYTGDYRPQLRPNSSDVFQNYTVQVPSTMATGPALLTVARFYLLGAGASPVIQTVNTTLIIQ
ncbi:hypothetical protein ONZ51_g13341 [Trametes cubensis]|uniref:Uncharacterized protein n=1 Tax=Trametes cubensis TaxID=1111947 RepID=A0AAD7TEW9_9APHY|nr:hypothetical protein ONZ51_g13341 [Trametes cubensis]